MVTGCWGPLSNEPVCPGKHIPYPLLVCRKAWPVYCPCSHSIRRSLMASGGSCSLWGPTLPWIVIPTLVSGSRR